LKSKQRNKKCLTFIDPRMRYFRTLTIILIISIVSFIFFAIVAYFNPMYDAFGPGILFSRGAALAILLLTMFGMFLVTYDLTTWVRNKLKRRWNTVFDFQILFHRFSGFLITIYSYIHTVGHLTGSIRALDKEKDVNKINSVLTHKRFDKHLNYFELLFTTIPGVTGILLMIIITLMWGTSLKWVRKRWFQLFSTVHVFCFPSFIILIIIHGSDTWLNYGFPLGSITVGISLLIYLFFWIRKLFYQCKGKFSIKSVEVSESGNFIYLHLNKPKHYNYMEGQYIFLNCPDVSWWEWHPFSISSSKSSPHISFFIKDNGNFTKKLFNLIKKQKNKNKNCIEENTNQNVRKMI